MHSMRKNRSIPALFLASALAFGIAMPGVALAAEANDKSGSSTGSSIVATPAEEMQPYVILDGKSTIEKREAAVREAQEAHDEAVAEVEKIQARIDDIESELPIQQKRVDESMKQRYIAQSNPLKIVSVLINSSSLDEALRYGNYLEHIMKEGIQEVTRLNNLKTALEGDRAEQERLNAEANEKFETAEAALDKEREKRIAKQEKAIANAVEQVKKGGGKKSIGVAYDGGKQDESYKVAASTDVKTLSDGADWSMTQEEFIEEWAPRIDDYLEGSPLEGQGENFASAAWKYCVDPRWSPAISNTESSKGSFCIRPYNAWGWGAADIDPYGLALEWGSWEEAIDAHVKGLAEGYGYTISMSNARKYCPITWQDWYNHTLSEMKQI